MLAGIWALGRAMLLADEFQRLGKHVASGAGFMFNLTLFMDTKAYFGAITSPLIHLWSLGVEEQFYLFWPLFLLATWKLGKKQFGVIIGVAIISFILNVSAVSAHPLAAFYLPWNRLWELALGGVLAYSQLGKTGRLDRSDPAPSTRESRLTMLLAPYAGGVIGVLLILASCASIDERKAFPGWWALGPCLGAFLLISAGPQSWINRHLLSRRSMVFIGLISYPLYLWHWPLPSFAHTANWRGFTPAVKLAAVAISFVLATLTYKYIERPIRSSPKVLRLAVPLFAAMLVCLSIGYMTFQKSIRARALSADIDRFVLAAKEPNPYPKQEGYLTLGNGPRTTLFIGDSTVAQYYGRISKLQKEHPDSHKAVFVWQAGCAPDPALSLVNAAGCQKLIQSAVEYAKDSRVDTVVIGFCWYAYFVGFIQPDRVGEAGPLVPATDRALSNIKSMIAGFVSQGKRVYIVLQLPVDGGFQPRQMIRRTVFGPGFRVDSRPAERATIDRAIGPFITKLVQIANDTNAKVIDPMNSLCNEKDCSPVTAGGDPIYHDSWHLRSAYIREHIDYLDATILAPSGKSGAGL